MNGYLVIGTRCADAITDVNDTWSSAREVLTLTSTMGGAAVLT